MQFLEDQAHKLRILSILSTTAAGSGHPTSCMSMAEIMSVLFFHEMVWDPQHADASDPDEFVLSKGHAAPVYYAALALAGAISMDELERLRTFGSTLEGHPVPRLKWVRAATGSLGQGLSVGVGLALAQKMHKSKRRVFVVLGDGEMAEGQVWEAMNCAVINGLDNLIAIIDENRLAQSGPTMHEWRSQAYVQKAQAFGWNSLAVNGHSVTEISSAIEEAGKSKHPTLIVAKTVKGKGYSAVENVNGHHGVALDAKEAKKAIHVIESRLEGVTVMPRNFVALPEEHRKETAPRVRMRKYTQPVATRDAFGDALMSLGMNEQVVVVDGDVQNSTRTQGFATKFPQRFIQGFIAEQNMISLCVGLSKKGFLPVVSTFSAFLTRGFDQLRMANYSDARMVIVGSHSGVSIGEDGPSQMGLEDVAMMRALPGVVVLCPCDGHSAQALTQLAVNGEGILYVRTMRGATPLVYEADEKFTVGGSHIVYESKRAKCAILAAGVTVHEAIAAAKALEAKGIQCIVVDMYSISPLDKKRVDALCKTVKRIITVEDHSINGGLGDAVSYAVGGRVPVVRLGVKKVARSGTPEELRAFMEIDAKAIMRAVKGQK